MRIVTANVAVFILGLFAACFAVGCAFGNKLADFETRLGNVEGDIAAVKTTIGGDGDSIVSWILAASLGAAVVYPLIWRPIRVALAKRKRPQA